MVRGDVVMLMSHTSQTVYSEKCKSWYKGGKDEGRVVALWPGTYLDAAFKMISVSSIVTRVYAARTAHTLPSALGGLRV